MSVERARTLRREMTDAERRLWRILRSRQLEGYKFRRQAPIDHYIADFVCFSHRLIIEAYGGQHAIQVKRDQHRTDYLERNGFRGIRFWNNEVFESVEGVCAHILEVLSETAPHPDPLPQGERGFSARQLLPLPLREREGPIAKRWKGEGPTIFALATASP